MATETERTAAKAQALEHLRNLDLNKPGIDHMLEANALVNGERQAAYGPPAIAYERIARIWGGLLGVKITAQQAALMMVALKIQRQMERPKRDNLVDAHGYLVVAAHCEGA